MMFERIRDSFAIVSVFIALVAFTYSILLEQNRANEADLREWQKTIVLSIITNANENGIKFNVIRASYGSEARAYEQFEVPKSELQPATIRRIILELIADGAIIQINNDVYSLYLEKKEPIDEVILKLIKFQQGNNLVLDKLAKILSSNPGKFTRKDLVVHIVNDTGIALFKASGVVSQAIASRLIFVDPRSKHTFLATDAPDFAFRPPQMGPATIRGFPRLRR